MEITNNYSNYIAPNMAYNRVADNAKKRETEIAPQVAEIKRTESLKDYVNKLAKLAPSVKMKIGHSLSADRTGKTLTINPALLKEMQNDPKKEKEMKELIRGVETITKFMDGIDKASGRTVVFRHSYIDENGKYCSYSQVKKVDKISPKLRAERRKNSEKLIKRIRTKSAKNRRNWGLRQRYR